MTPVIRGCGEVTAPRRGRPWSRGNLSPDEITDFNGILYFRASDSDELWRSDGTEAGTTMVKDINPADTLGQIYLTHRRQGHPLLRRVARRPHPRASCGEATAPRPARPLSSRSGRHLRPHRRQGKILYFSAEEGCGEATAPRKERPSSRETAPAATSAARSLTTAKGTLYLVGTDKRHGQELWRSDGTRKGTRIVRDIRRGSASSEPTNLTAVGGTLFFTAKDGRHGRELWRAGPRPCRTAKGKCKKKG